MTLKSFTRFVNEDLNTKIDQETPLKGYEGDQIIKRIEELMEILADDVRFGVPSDQLGRATTYRDANAAIQKIKDMMHYYSSKQEEVRFYVWSVSYNGTWQATKGLRKKVEGAGGFGEDESNMSLKKMLDYFKANPEDSDNIRSISISMDSDSIRKATSPKEKQEVEPQEKEAAQTEEETTNQTENK
jgi:hypothetical protein